MDAIALYAKASADFDAKLAETSRLLLEGAREFAPLAQASSLGAEDMVITDLLDRLGIEAEVFVLDTGKLHAETLALRARIEARYGCRVAVYGPDERLAEEFVATHGEDAMYRSVALRKACCQLRKLEPLERALAGKWGWITGLRREQSHGRAEVEFIEDQAQRAKLNPLARWTWGDVWHYIARHDVPYNPLHDRFFPSIGCAPCTRAVTLGEDFRAGRWWWEQDGAKECGLHVDAPGAQSAIPIRSIS